MTLIEKLRNLKTEQQQGQAIKETAEKPRVAEERQKQAEIERIKENNRRTAEKLFLPSLSEVNKEWLKGTGKIESVGEPDKGFCKLIWNDTRREDGYGNSYGGNWNEISIRVHTFNNTALVFSGQNPSNSEDEINLKDKYWKDKYEDELIKALRSNTQCHAEPHHDNDARGGING